MEFQFQNGAIISNTGYGAQLINSRFQFQNGAIIRSEIFLSEKSAT